MIQNQYGSNRQKCLKGATKVLFNDNISVFIKTINVVIIVIWSLKSNYILNVLFTWIHVLHLNANPHATQACVKSVLGLR